mgnify:CR=1 FL=1
MAKKKTNQIQIKVIIVIMFAILSLIGIEYKEIEEFFNPTKSVINKVTAEESENIVLEGDSILQIHFFDVGQADSILLINNNETMLIDAGNNEDGNKIVSNIKKLGIEKIDYLVGTHPHKDHIGGLDNVISNFEIKNIYMPKVQTNTKTFEDVLNAVESKNLKITTPKQGEKFTIGNTECEIMLEGTETNKQQENLNLASIALRVTYKEQSYLFMADCEEENENSRTWPQTNVLKVGHHGSNTSTSKDFLNEVLPQISIISLGKDNDYGHPHQTTIDKLEKLGTLTYRTDEKGNILLESDGKNNKISFY